jgi:hypothetical protein
MKMKVCFTDLVIESRSDQISRRHSICSKPNMHKVLYLPPHWIQLNKIPSPVDFMDRGTYAAQTGCTNKTILRTTWHLSLVNTGKAMSSILNQVERTVLGVTNGAIPNAYIPCPCRTSQGMVGKVSDDDDNVRSL